MHLDRKKNEINSLRSFNPRKGWKMHRLYIWRRWYLCCCFNPRKGWKMHQIQQTQTQQQTTVSIPARGERCIVANVAMSVTAGLAFQSPQGVKDASVCFLNWLPTRMGFNPRKGWKMHLSILVLSCNLLYVSIPARGERCIKPLRKPFQITGPFQSPQGVKDASEIRKNTLLWWQLVSIPARGERCITAYWDNSTICKCFNPRKGWKMHQQVLRLE